MKSLAIMLSIMELGSWAARAELPPDWSTNFQAALVSANTNQQPALVYFTASWCGPCKLMTRTTLADTEVTQTLRHFEHVAIDIDEHPDLASQHGITAVPTFIFLSPGGNEVDRATGFQPARDFLQWLTNGVAEAKEAAVRQALARRALADIDQLLVATGANSARLAAVQLFDLSAIRDDDIVQAAAARLRTLAGRDPTVLLNGLADPRLAVRISVANALRLSIGDSFDVDPWGDAADRGKAISAWRGKLTQATESEKPH
jgi:thioredoxin 1